MKFLNNLIRFVIFILWAFGVYYIAKAIGFTYDPEGDSALRTFIRITLIIIILGGAYFIWKIDFLKRKKKD